MIHNLLIEACLLIEEKMNHEVQISHKTSHRDLVTNVDQEIEQFLSSELLRLYPGCKILGEESNHEINMNEGSIWIIDPLDGTSNFVAQGENFGILLTYYKEGVALEAYMCDVIKRDIYHAQLNLGVTKNKTKLEIDYNATFDKTLISMSSCFLLSHVKEPQKLIKESFGIRYIGSCAIDGIGVIEGRLGAYAIRLSSIWDIAPHLLFAEELGLVCINIDGSIKTIDQSMPFIFGQKQIVNQLLEYC